MTDSLGPITVFQLTLRHSSILARFEGFPHPIPVNGDEAQMLQKVVNREPVPFRPHKAVPDYLLCYVVETLACGHQLTIYPQTDSLIAVRRDCPQCGCLVPKKRPYSVVSTRSEVHKAA